MKDTGAQRRASMKSPLRGIVGQQDRGQRFKVVYRDGSGIRREFGFTDDRAVAEKWINKISDNPMWRSAQIVDRKPKAAP